MSTACIFCRIVGGRAQGHFVHKDELCTAFLDVHPFSPGHTLVVSNRHVARLSKLPHETGAHMFATAMRIAGAITASGLRSDGFNVFLSDGECAGRELPHIHLHVLPRFTGDGLHVFDRDPSCATLADLATVASTIKRHMGRSA